MKRIHKGIALLLILTMTVTMTACSKHTPAVTSSLSSSELVSSLDSSSTLGDLESSVSSQSASSIASSSSTAASSAASSSSAKAKSSSAVASTKSNRATAAANTAPKGSGSASRNTEGTGTKAPGNTNAPAPKAQPAPTQKPSEPAKPTQPKTAYDKPYDITQIRNDMIAYGKSRGMQYTESLNITNAAYDFPGGTADCCNANLKKESQENVEYVIKELLQLQPGTKITDIRFNVEIQPDPYNSGEYLLYVPYG